MEFAVEDKNQLLTREWLQTDGLGGYASLSAAMGPTRRYHGLLVANLPDIGPHVMLQRLDLSLILENGRMVELAEVTYQDGTRYPAGGERVTAFECAPGAQTTWQAEGFTLRMSVLMPRQEIPWQPVADGQTAWAGSEVLVRVEVLGQPAGAKAQLRLRPMVPARSAHALTKANFSLNPRAQVHGRHVSYHPYHGLPHLILEAEPPLEFHDSPDWHQNLVYAKDAARGYTEAEDVFSPGFFEFPLLPCITVRAGLARSHALPHDLWDAAMAQTAARPRPLGLDPAAFLTQLPGQGPSLIAGYPWFGAWGRDTAISVPGLCFAQGQLDAGLDLIASLLARTPHGLVANLFGSDGAGAENAVDATLLTFWACSEYVRLGGSMQTLADRCGADLMRILNLWLHGDAPHVTITEQGLPRAGNAGTNFTWMDAKVDGQPVTPRAGMPVEMAALWLNALQLAKQLNTACNLPLPPHCLEALEQGKQAFDPLFFLPKQGYFADRLDEAGQPDPLLRPNQLWAIWLGVEQGFVPLEHAKAALIQIGEHLLTPVGLRTLAPGSKDYCPIYSGNPSQRDYAYHQGTVWPWMTGIYVSSVAAVATQGGKKINSQALRNYFGTLFAENSPSRAGYAGIPEVFDADAPHLPEGCPWQAWSVAEILRAELLLR